MTKTEQRRVSLEAMNVIFVPLLDRGMRAEQRLNVHEARQQESQVAVQDTLKRLEVAIEKQQKMIEDLWKKSVANLE